MDDDDTSKELGKHAKLKCRQKTKEKFERSWATCKPIVEIVSIAQ
jgi:hypothetical protein